MAIKWQDFHDFMTPSGSPEDCVLEQNNESAPELFWNCTADKTITWHCSVH